MKQGFATYYNLLEIDVDASEEMILKAWKEKVKVYHPDKNEGGKAAHLIFQYLQEAKEVLTNPEARLEYDYAVGVRERPVPAPKIIRVKEQKLSGEAILGAGFIGLLIGIFLTKE